MLKRTWIALWFTCLGWVNLSAQPYTDGFNRKADSLILDSLRFQFANNKTIPAAVEQQALRALSFYPELHDIKVEFVWVEYKTAHTSRPKISTLLRRRDRRTYQITISTSVPEFYIDGRQDRLPYNAQIGVLGHELGHTTPEATFHRTYPWRNPLCAFEKGSNPNGARHRSHCHRPWAGKSIVGLEPHCASTPTTSWARPKLFVVGRD
jgi:hypothetical protein